MTAERLLRYACQAGFLQAFMACRAAIHGTHFRKPYLLYVRVEMALQRNSVAASVDERKILLLVMTPLTEVVLRRRYCKNDHQQYADYAKCAERIRKKCLPS